MPKVNSLHITETSFPAVTNCTRCDNLLVGRDDEMKVYRVQIVKKGKSWPTVGWICEPCNN